MARVVRATGSGVIERKPSNMGAGDRTWACCRSTMCEKGVGGIRTSGDELKEVGSHLKWELAIELGLREGHLEILTTAPSLHPYGGGGILITRFGDQHHLNGFICK